MPKCSHITIRGWNKLRLNKICLLEFINLRENCKATQAGWRYAKLKTTSGQEDGTCAMTGTPCSLSSGWKPVVLVYELELSMMTMLTRFLFHATLVSKRLKDKFLLNCTAFAHERQVLWFILEDALGVMEYADTYVLDSRLMLLRASPDKRPQYLLGPSSVKSGPLKPRNL
jgi:hypothetical protein